MNDRSTGIVYEQTDAQSRDTRVAMACTVEAVSGNVVTVRPAFNERVNDEQGRTLSDATMGEIVDVPVALIAGIRVELQVGDHGLLLFHDVALDNYLDGGNVTGLGELTRFHDYSDAIFLPFDIRGTYAAEAIATLNIDGVITFHKRVRFEDDIEINEQLFTTHMHGGVTRGSAATDGVL